MDKRVEIINRATKQIDHTLLKNGDDTVLIPPNSDITLITPRDSVSAMLRDGDDLLITFADGAVLRLEGYFSCPSQDMGQLTLSDPQDAGQWLVSLSETACVLPGDMTSEPLNFSLSYLEAGAASASTSAGLSSGLLVGLGAAALGGVVAAAAGGGGGRLSPERPIDDDPPAAPLVDPSNGSIVTGTAEAGATIRIDLNGDGTTDANVTTGADGKWSYQPSTPLANGTAIQVIAIDAAGNASQPTRIVIDSVAPAAPIIDDGNGSSLSGTAEAGSTIRLDLDGDGSADATVTADANGQWHYVPPAPLADGTTVTVTATDRAGNVSAPATQTIDRSAPSAPAIGAAIDDAGSVQGIVANSGLTDDRQPLLTGTAEPGAEIEIFDNGALIGAITADSSGAWTFAPAAPLAEGDHAFTIVATDAAGNASAPSAPYMLTVDTTAPAAPLLGPTDGLTVSGRAEAGATIAIDTDGDGVADAFATASAAGRWTVTLPSQLANGTLVSATATDAAGNSSPSSTASVDTGTDTTAPPVPVIGSVVDDAGALQGPLSSGSATDDSAPRLNGSGAEVGATISIYDNDILIGSVPVDGSGNWSFTPIAALGDGLHKLTVTATDANGNESAPSVPFDLVIDTQAPAAPTVSPSNGAGLAGTAEAGASIAIDLGGDGTVDATVTADAAGNWAYAPDTRILDGTLVSVIASDAAGNISAPATVIVDAAVPIAPAISSVTDNVDAQTGLVMSGGTSNDATPTLGGTAEPGSTVYVYDGGMLVGTTSADGTGAWSFTPAALLAGAHSFAVTATDESGNVSGPSTGYAITIDLGAPSAPVLDPTDGITLSGTAEPGATVAVDSNGDGTADATVTANAAGDWSVSFTPPLANGAVVSAIAVDPSGNASTPATATVNAAIDTTPPPIPTIGAVTDDVSPVQGPVGNGGSTNDAQPLLSGTAEAGVLVSIYDNGALIGTVSANGLGMWSFTPTLTNGVHQLTATTKDGNGNESLPTAVFTLSIDTAAPAAPTIAASNGSTLSGTAEPGAMVNLDITGDGTADVSVTVDGLGSWSYIPPTPIGNGTLVTATATDAAGNISGGASVTIDRAPPPAPLILAAEDDLGAVRGTLGSGASTDDGLPTLSGTAEANASVSIYDNGALIGFVNADGSGAWSFTPPAPLDDGTHALTAVATDVLGNGGPASAVFNLNIDSSAPALPAILSVGDNVGLSQGPLATGALTDDTQPTLAGTAEADARIDIFDAGGLIATTTAGPSGAWSFTSTTALGQGGHSFTVTATDAAGNSSGLSAAFALTIDSLAPQAPAITGYVDDAGSVQGNFAGGTATDDTRPTLSGTAEANATVIISDNGAVIASVTANALGIWSYTPAAPLPAAVHNFTAVARDATGNVGQPSAAFVIEIDTTPPAPPTIGSVSDDVRPQLGVVGNGGFTNDVLPVLSGTAEPGATVAIYDGAVLIGTVAAGVGGAWSFTPSTALAEGTHSFTAIASDPPGSAGLASAAYVVTIDTTPPATPTIDFSDGQLLTGTADTGSSVNIDLNGDGTADISVTATSPGVWSYAPANQLADGTTVIVTASDAAGNLSGSDSVIIDRAAPAVPQIAGLTDDVGARTGTVLDGQTTDDTLPVVRGTAEVGATVTIYQDGVQISEQVADSTGNWAFALTSALSSGPHAFTATATDATGNVSPLSAALNVTIDTSTPAIPAITAIVDHVAPAAGTLIPGSATNDTQPQISGTADANSSISVYDGTTLLGGTSADINGNWSFTPPSPLGEGPHSLTAVASNAAGTPSAPSPAIAISVDTAAPASPAILTLTDDALPQLGLIGAGGFSNDPTPVIAGTAEANATVSIYANGNLLGTANADGSGSWSFTAPALLDGGQAITTTATDSAGNVSALSAAFSFTLDTAAPATPLIAPSRGVTISGTADPGAFVNIDVNNDATIEVQVQANGSGLWSWNPPQPLAGGTIVSVIASDTAGNVSGPAQITVDTTPPAAPVLLDIVDDQGGLSSVAPGAATNDSQPQLVGTTEANATVTILDNGAIIGAATADGSGAWSFTPTTPLAPGPHSITLLATDVAGNAGAAGAARTFTVDLSPPAAPLLVSVTDDQSTQQGIVANGGATNDQQPDFAGTAEPNATITIFNNGVEVDQVTADGTGAWNWTPVTPLGEAVYGFTFTATDPAGNQGSPSPVYSVTVDLTPPAPPALNDTDGRTISGTAEPGTTITLDVSGAPTAIANAFGEWSITLVSPLSNGTPVTAIATDAAGNPSAPSPVELVDTGIDTTPTAVPVILSITDDVDLSQGSIINGGVTNDGTPLITGTAAANVSISIYDGNTLIGSVNSDASGNWSFSQSLADGAHSISATATGGNGQESVASPSTAFTIDTAPPTTPLVDPSNGAILSGTAEAGATVTIDFGSAPVTVTADTITGAWSYTPASPLANGTLVTISAADAAGNVSLAPATLTIDRAPPATISIDTVADDAGTVTAAVLNGGVTDDRTPALSGTTEAGASVAVFDNGVQIGTATANGSGAWTFPVATPLAEGGHIFTATATDALGNVTAQSAAFAITIDLTGPAAPTITGLADDFGVPGPVTAGGVTNDSTPTLSGTAEANASIAIFDGAGQIGTTQADANGAWTFPLTAPLTTGPHSLTVVATDVAGNVGTASAPFAFSVDTTAPAAPLPGTFTDDVGLIQGALVAGSVTDDTRPTFTGTAEANAVITIFEGSTRLGTATADGIGAWSFTPTSPLAAGLHSLTFSATDAAGNSGPAASFGFTIDTAAPAAPAILSALDDVGTISGSIVNGGATDDALPFLSGTAEANAIVSIYDNGALLGTVLADGLGGWSFTPPTQLTSGQHSFTATARDPAGNVGIASSPYVITVDTVAPIAPIIVSVADDVGTRTGPLTNGAATDDAQPLLGGTAEAGSTVTIYDNGVQIGTTSANGSGAWSFTPSILTQGDHSFTARATDASGNVGPGSSPFAIRVDTTAPLAPVIASLTDDIGTIQGQVASGGVTNDTLPLLRGTGEAGATLALSANGTLLGTTQVDAAGNWSFTPSAPLAEGTYSFSAIASDAAGNSGPTSNLFTVTVDTTAPAVPTITSVSDDAAPVTGPVTNGGISNDTTPTLTGTATAGSTVLILDNGAVLGSAVANASGAWSFTPATALGNGAHSFTTVAVDAAGNASSASGAYGITVDTVAPTAAIAITALSIDTGTVGDWSTQDNSPTISGTLGTTLAAGERVEISIDSGSWVNATVAGNSWFYGAGTLAVGGHSVAVRVVDAAGNVGNSASQAITITNVQQAPIVQASGTALLGLVGAEALNLLDIGTQSLTAFDPNNNLKSVQVRFAPLLSLALGSYTLTASTALAAELGLQIAVTNTAGLLGIVAPTSTLTITAIDGGPINNVAINELLNTVHFEQNLSLLSLDVLSATTITATDTTGLSAASGVGSLLDLSLLNASGSANVLEGNNNANTINGPTGNDRLYGHGGADVLNGGGGNDLLRGGAGADTLNGGGGNDTLVYDAADTLIDGGTGTDTLLIESGTGPVLNLDAVNNIRNIERIDLGLGDAGRQITLSEAGVLRATGGTQLTVNGDGNDRVTMTGAAYQGQTLINGEAYNHYTLGSTDIFVDHPVLVVV